MFHENLFLDFILPSIQNLFHKYGKGNKDNNYNKPFITSFEELVNEYADKLESRKTYRDILEKRRKEYLKYQKREEITAIEIKE